MNAYDDRPRRWGGWFNGSRRDPNERYNSSVMGRMQYSRAAGEWLFHAFCHVVVILSISLGIILVVCQFFVVIQSFEQYREHMKVLYKSGPYSFYTPARGYEKADGSTSACGFLAFTNYPKHFLGNYMAFFFEVSLIWWIIHTIFIDFTIFNLDRYRGGQWGGRQMIGGLEGPLVRAGSWQYLSLCFWADVQPSMRAIVGNGFVKMWIGMAFLSQTFAGITTGNHNPGGHGTDMNKFCLWTGMISFFYPVLCLLAQVCMMSATELPMGAKR